MNSSFHGIPFYPFVILIKMVVMNGGIDCKRLIVFLCFLLRSIAMEPFRLVEHYVYRKKIASHKLNKDPIFVLGHWRSGTTYLQSLLCCDPCIATNSIFRGIFSDSYFLTEKWLNSSINWLCRILKIRYLIQRSFLNLNLPAELDLALCFCGSSHAYSWGYLFPRFFLKQFEEKVIFHDEKKLEEWLVDYDYLIRKLSYWSNGRRILVKSPGDTARLVHLIKLYPDAKFIFIYRDPISVYYSNKYLWSVVQGYISLQLLNEQEIDQLILHVYPQLLTRYLAERESVPCHQLIEINYISLRSDPVAMLKQIYKQLDLGNFPLVQIKEYLQLEDVYEDTKYITTIEEEKLLRERWAFSFDEWFS